MNVAQLSAALQNEVMRRGYLRRVDYGIAILSLDLPPTITVLKVAAL